MFLSMLVSQRANVALLGNQAERGKVMRNVCAGLFLALFSCVQPVQAAEPAQPDLADIAKFKPSKEELSGALNANEQLYQKALSFVDEAAKTEKAALRNQTEKPYNQLVAGINRLNRAVTKGQADWEVKKKFAIARRADADRCYAQGQVSAEQAQALADSGRPSALQASSANASFAAASRHEASAEKAELDAELIAQQLRADNESLNAALEVKREFEAVLRNSVAAISARAKERKQGVVEARDAHRRIIEGGNLITPEQMKDSYRTALQEGVVPEVNAPQPNVQVQPNPQNPRVSIKDLDGKATIVGDDATFLGKITSNEFDRLSVLNTFGPHGSPFTSASIFNTVGKYGSSVSPTSAFNDIATKPPKVYMGEKFVGYLTTNELKTPRIDPHALISVLKDK